MSAALKIILEQCSGVKVKTQAVLGQKFNWLYPEKVFKVGDIELPERGVFIEITATATKGTIARVISIEGLKTTSTRYSSINKYKDSREIVTQDATFIYEVEGRQQKGRIKARHTMALPGTPKTKYVRNVQPHEKVKNPVNKYKQEMKRGDWVIGVKHGNSLGIGRITRWTNSNVWGVSGDDLDDKSKEFRFASISETFTMPDNEHVKLLTVAVLKGWKGT